MTIIEVKIIPNAKKNNVEEIEQSKFRVHVMAPAVDGKANKALIETLANHLGIKKNKISISRGETSRIKILKIED